MIKILVQLQTMLDVIEWCEMDPCYSFYVKNLDEDEQYLLFEELENHLSKIDFPSSEEIEDCVAKIIDEDKTKKKRTKQKLTEVRMVDDRERV